MQTAREQYALKVIACGIQGLPSASEQARLRGAREGGGGGRMSGGVWHGPLYLAATDHKSLADTDKMTLIPFYVNICGGTQQAPSLFD
jgi:hypothetical protein